MSTKRIKLTVAYDGADFCGWAAQTGRRTVQGTLTEAVRQVSGENVEIVGASRTDGGAHAEGQVCHFDSNVPIPTENWVGALNRVLPPDLKVVSARRVSRSFHSRFCALDRTYRYAFYEGTPDPRRERYALWLAKRPDVRAMRLAAKLLAGEHDFRAFSEELGPEVENTRRTIFRVAVRETGADLTLEFRGTAFLRGMVRRMAGFLLQVGFGKRLASDVGALLDPDRRDALTWPEVLPAKGLTLVRVRYGPRPKDVREMGE